MTPLAVLLGTGTSTGVPMVGKAYPPSFLANPKNHRLRPAMLLRGPEGSVLVDAGADLRQQLLRENVLDLEGVLITHTHADHIMGLDDLRPYCTRLKPEVDIYTLPRYQDDIRRVFDYAFKPFPPGIFVPRFRLLDVPDRLSLAGLDIEVLWVEHGEMPVMALRIGDFAYVTDVSHIPEPAWSRLQGLRVLILDGVRYQPHPNHYHFAKALQVAGQLGAEVTYLTHLSDDYDHDVVEQGLPPSIRLAFDGLKIPLQPGP